MNPVSVRFLFGPSVCDPQYSGPSFKGQWWAFICVAFNVTLTKPCSVRVCETLGKKCDLVIPCIMYLVGVGPAGEPSSCQNATP